MGAVGLVGFEPTTSCSQSRRAAKLRHNPLGVHYRAGGAVRQRHVKPLSVSYDAALYGTLPASAHGAFGVRKRPLAAAASAFVLLAACSSAPAPPPASGPAAIEAPSPDRAAVGEDRAGLNDGVEEGARLTAVSAAAAAPVTAVSEPSAVETSMPAPSAPAPSAPEPPAPEPLPEPAAPRVLPAAARPPLLPYYDLVSYYDLFLPGSPSPVDAPAPPPRDCPPMEPPYLFLGQADPAAASVALSQAVYQCAEEVGLAPADDPQAAAALVSGGLAGPLLLVGEGEGAAADLAAELERLAPDRAAAAGFEGEELEMLSEAAGFADLELAVVEAPPEAVLQMPGPGPGGRIWLASPNAPVAPLAAAASRLGIGLAVAEVSDLRALPAETREAVRAARQVDLVSDFGEDADWQLAAVRRGGEIPGGGLLLFDGGVNRRLVAIYGHPVTSALGVLGEQGPEEGVERLKEISAGYDADGASVLPTFEIIATVASAGAGRDGDYSSETALDVIRPWIEAAAAAGVYAVLDLQPGRTDFLTQAKIYEEFLRLPHVGLALDPEWRLKPNQVHLRQIGTVDAAEVNQVVRWLAGIVREEALPQKLLIVHQFRFSMITNREQIETPPELAVVIQMDGQGSQGAKDNTWDVLTRGTEESGYRWGWKNFYDEDIPTASSAKVVGLTPTPVFVSYQ